MESYFPTAAGIQLPFQRRLSRLYNDTKKSSDFVKEPVQNAEDPEIKVLHRKLRIQKDRLVSWGLEWSDPDPSADQVLIDTQLSKAGLSEVVGSIMSTIKDILAEAEPLWQSSKRLVGERPSGKAAATADQKIPIVVWDKSRFEDLVRDLTTSIDTLYDLSRTRSSAVTSSQATRTRLAKSGSGIAGSAEDSRLFEPSRMQTPQQINPQTLTEVKSPLEQISGGAHGIVFMSKQAYSELTRSQSSSAISSSAGTSQPYSPLLLEYAGFDPMFAMTGIMPPMTRFERLSTGLRIEPQRAPGSWTGLPRLLGYFEDMESSRLGLLYEFPSTFNPVSFDSKTQNPLGNLCSLADLLARPDFEPPLEAKFRLASNLANTIFDMHARGIAHGNLVDTNVTFCNGAASAASSSGGGTGEVDIRRPLVSSFELFPDTPSPEDLASREEVSLYRHPLDPHTRSGASVGAAVGPSTFDLYSLAMLLLSIGLWTSLENLVTHDDATAVSESVLDQLAIRCGTLYMKAVQVCWNAVEQEMTGQGSPDVLSARAQLRASRYLEACCIIDGVSGLEERLSDDMGDAFDSARTYPGAYTGSTSPPESSKEATYQAERQQQQEQAMTEKPGDDTLPPWSPTGQEQGWLPEKPPILPPRLPEKIPILPPRPQAEGVAYVDDASTKPAIKQRLRLYPQVQLPPEAVDQWNTVLMPQINQALRHFYRKHPESVEISLESIGDSPHTTTPTVLVVCTSVNKVKAILKRKLGDLIDGRGFAVKVCRGQVLRSRKQAPAFSRRSMAAGDGDKIPALDMTAANSDFQERPKNGASIGAWIGNRHLPPVSFGGLIVIDDKPYGMTVHHMLDDPDQDQEQDEPAQTAIVEKGEKEWQQRPPLRSAGRSSEQQIQELSESLANWYASLQNEASTAESSGSEDFACEFSDTDSEGYSESAITSDYSLEEYDDEEGGGEEDEHEEGYYEDPFGDGGDPGDVPGIEPGGVDHYMVTQPALDDVSQGFYVSRETQNEDHLCAFGLGEVYASSGIRRRSDSNGLIHEIDWALFEFRSDRRPDDNAIPAVADKAGNNDHHQISPTRVVPSDGLPGLEVQCVARTSGLQTGQILPTITSVKIYGRTTPSHTYQVSGRPSSSSPASPSPAAPPATASSSDSKTGSTIIAPRQQLPMGIPGDSGAWIVDRHDGRLCGHVLAWSERKRVAYICPMDVLLLDIAETLAAGDVRLPGGESLFVGLGGRLQHRDLTAATTATQGHPYTAAAARFAAEKYPSAGGPQQQQQLEDMHGYGPWQGDEVVVSMMRKHHPHPSYPNPGGDEQEEEEDIERGRGGGGGGIGIGITAATAPFPDEGFHEQESYDDDDDDDDDDNDTLVMGTPDRGGGLRGLEAEYRRKQFDDGLKHHHHHHHLVGTTPAAAAISGVGNKDFRGGKPPGGGNGGGVGGGGGGGGPPGGGGTTDKSRLRLSPEPRLMEMMETATTC